METAPKLDEGYNDKKKFILQDHISYVPGIRYRELSMLSGFSNGVLSYHLTGLEEMGLIRVQRKNRKNTRYYPKDIPEMESAVLPHLRHEPLREIILFILENRHCKFSDIVNYTGKAMSTVSLHLSKLKQEDIVSVRRIGNNFLYSLANPELIENVTSKYNIRLIDK